MTRMVQVALAEEHLGGRGTPVDARHRRHSSPLETAVDHHPRATEDAPQKVLVPQSSLEEAQHAIESMTDPDELISDE